MPRDSFLRASDADREEAAAALRESLTEGRLTLTEFEQRLEAAYAARTYGELDPLLVDLPRPAGSGPVTLSDAGAQLLERWQERRNDKERRRWSRFLAVNALCWTIWAVALFTPGHHHVEGLWPLVVTVPWGAVLLSRRQHPPKSRPPRLPSPRRP